MAVTILRADGATLAIDNPTGSCDYTTQIHGLFDLPQREPILSEGYPWGAVLVGTRRVPRQFSATIHIDAGTQYVLVANATYEAARDTLFQFLPEGELITLRMTRMGSSGYWDIDVLATVAPPPDEDNLAALEVTFLAPDPALRATVQSTETILLDSSHQTRTVTVTGGGNVAASPMLTLLPTAPKTDRWNLARVFTVTNPRAVQLRGEPVAVPFDFAWHFHAGKIYADGRDLRVLVDGVFHDFWFGNFPADIAGTSTSPDGVIWVEVDLEPDGSVQIEVLYTASGALAWTNSTDGPIFDRDYREPDTDNPNRGRRWAGAFMDTPGTQSSRSAQWHLHSAAATGMAPLQRALDSPWTAAPDTTTASAAGAEIPLAGTIQGYAGLAYSHLLGIQEVTWSGQTQLTPTLEKFVLRVRRPDYALEDIDEIADDTHASLTAFGPITDSFDEREAIVFALRSLSVHTSDAGPIAGADDVAILLADPLVVVGDGAGSDNEVPIYLLEATVTNTTTGESFQVVGRVTAADPDASPIVWNQVVLDFDPLNGQTVLMGNDTDGYSNFYSAFTITPPITPGWFHVRSGSNSITVADEAVDGLTATLDWYARKL